VLESERWVSNQIQSVVVGVLLAPGSHWPPSIDSVRCLVEQTRYKWRTQDLTATNKSHTVGCLAWYDILL